MGSEFYLAYVEIQGCKSRLVTENVEKVGRGEILQSSRTEVCEAEAAGYHLEEVHS